MGIASKYSRSYLFISSHILFKLNILNFNLIFRLLFYNCFDVCFCFMYVVFCLNVCLCTACV